MGDSTRRSIAEGKYLRLLSIDGWEAIERVRGTGVVCIIAVTDDRRVILVEQYRPPVGKRVIELPAGLVGDDAAFGDEALAAAARRELLEETGYSADVLDDLGTFASSAGLTNELVTFFAARSLRQTSAGGGDGSEDITVHEVALDQIDEWLRKAVQNDVIIDARIFTGLYLVRLMPDGG